MASTIATMLSVGLLPSFLKKRYYRMRGAKIGKGVSIGFLSTIDANRVEIGDNSRIGMMVRIKAKQFKMGSYSRIRNSTTISAPRVRIGNETIISNDVIIGGMESWNSKFVIGDRCTIFPKCFINPTKDIIIGNDVGIGGSNYLFTHGSWSNALEGFPMGFGPIIIEDRVWLPWRVFVLPNVTIGHDAVVAAGSVISKSIPPMTLAAGVPAKVIKDRDEFVTKPTKQDKIQTLQNWFSEFEDFLKIERLVVDEISDQYIWSSIIKDSKGKQLGSVFVVESVNEDMIRKNEGRKYFITLEEIQVDLKAMIENSDGAWFDISKYEWCGSRNRLAIELRTFLERFGVRFESIDLRKGI
ncbi:MAG: hypothetical protein E4H14_15185 [Candidatus Thorarchaeota archaeon]|nr:MAG: hypothetical protein E4H14_15185 [Candidatus Thorarchaeota archaeon]